MTFPCRRSNHGLCRGNYRQPPKTLFRKLLELRKLLGAAIPTPRKELNMGFRSLPIKEREWKVMEERMERHAVYLREIQKRIDKAFNFNNEKRQNCLRPWDSLFSTHQRPHTQLHD